jgi:hypothetical protein
MPQLSGVPTQPVTQESVVNTIKDFVKNNVTVAGQPADVSGGKVDFPLPAAKPASGSMGVSVSTPMEMPEDYRTRVALEQKTSSDFATYLGTSSTPMSKEDTIKAIANQIQKDSGGKVSSEEAKAQATKSYDDQMEVNASKVSSMSDKEYETGKARMADQYRHNGESQKDYQERLAENSRINAITDPEKRKEALAAFTMSKLGDKYIPVLLTRADGRKKVLAAFQSVANLPASSGVPRNADEYYDAFTHPFKVIMRKETNGSAQVGVVYYSHLFKSLKPGDTQSITGLLSTPTDTNTGGGGSGGTPGTAPSAPSGGTQNPTPPSRNSSGINGWVSATDGNYVYLELGISTSDGSVTSANIKCDSSFNGTANAWTTGSYVEDDGGSPKKQNKARIALAKIVGGFPEQYVTTNLVMSSICIGGKAANYPIPY